MAKARIFRPDKNAMQSGRADMKHWILAFMPEKPYFVDNLMGWVGMTDMPQEVKLTFPTREAAEAYAKAQKINYEIILPKKRHQILKAYADNFKFDKLTG